MNTKRIGLIAVFTLVVIIVIIKARPAKTPNSSQSSSGKPQVVLVATPAEAVSVTRCGEIVQAVRTAALHGVRVQELTPDSKSELIARYRVLQTPTVLVFDEKGEVTSRFEGEAPETLSAIQTEMGRITR